jgi:uncharacterized protein YecA (UPF0149 family)
LKGSIPPSTSLNDLYPEEAYEEIERAFDLGLVDEFTIRLREVDQQLARGKDHVLQRLREKSVYIEDTVEILKNWAAFEPKEPKPPVRPAPQTRSQPYLFPSVPEPDSTSRSIEPRVGRNEPCPCGSGKKFKKCCGSAAR